MDNTRQQKIARLIQKTLSEIFRCQTAKIRGTFVSVSSVRVSPDLSVAHVRLSIFPSERAAEILGNIRNSSRSIRHEFAAEVRYQLRHIPELIFHLDDSLDYLDHIDSLLYPEGSKPKENPYSIDPLNDPRPESSGDCDPGFDLG